MGTLSRKRLLSLTCFVFSGQNVRSGKFKDLKYSENVNFAGTNNFESILEYPGAARRAEFASQMRLKDSHVTRRVATVGICSVCMRLNYREISHLFALILPCGPIEILLKMYLLSQNIQ